MVCPDNEQLSCALQPVPPLLQGEFDCQKFPITDVLVPFCGGETMREKKCKGEAYHPSVVRGQLPLPCQMRPPLPQTAVLDQAGPNGS